MRRLIRCLKPCGTISERNLIFRALRRASPSESGLLHGCLGNPQIESTSKPASLSMLTNVSSENRLILPRVRSEMRG